MSTSLKIPSFHPSNFASWRSLTIAALDSFDPSIMHSLTDHILDSKYPTLSDNLHQLKLDFKARSIIANALPYTVFQLVENCDSTKEMIDILTRKFGIPEEEVWIDDVESTDDEPENSCLVGLTDVLQTNKGNEKILSSNTNMSPVSSESNREDRGSSTINRSKEHIWYLDSGCSRHMTGFKYLLEDYVKKTGPTVTYGDNSKGIIKGYGTIRCKSVVFKNVSYVKGLKHNLISISQVCDADYEVHFNKREGKI